MLVSQIKGSVRLLRFLPDSRRLLVAMEMSDEIEMETFRASEIQFAILDPVTGEVIPLKVEGHDDVHLNWRLGWRPNLFAMHPSGDWVSIAWADRVQSFRTKDGKPRPAPDIEQVNHVVISPRGDRTLIGEKISNTKKAISAYKIGEKKDKFLWRMEMSEDFNCVAGFLPDGERFVSLENVIRIRHVDDGRELVSGKYKIFGRGQPRISADGRLLSFFARCSMYIVDLETLAKARKLVCVGNADDFIASAFHPANGNIAFIYRGPTLLRSCSIHSLNLLQSYNWKIGHLRSVDFSPDGMVGAVGSEDGRIVVWDVE